MNKKCPLLIAGIVIIAIAIVALILLWRMTPHELSVLQMPITSTTTDRSNLTPLGTPYTRPPEGKSSATTTQSGKIDEHLTIDNTFRDVNFCGTTYRVKQVFIDGVDVVQRIAKLVTASNLDYMREICDRTEGLRRNGWLNLDKNEIGVSPVIRDASTVDSVYQMSLVSPTGNLQPIGDFKIDASTGEVMIILQGFADFSEKPIGKLE
jgi:hypothetical protein